MYTNDTTDSTRDERGRFKTGNPGGPAGRKCGRARALAVLDEMLETEGCLELLQKALEEDFRKNPMKFFRQILMPLLPKETKVDMGDSGPVRVVWQSLAEAFPPEKDSGAAAPGNETT